MPGRNRRTPPPADPMGPVLILLEDIRAQNKTTIEAVETHREETRRDMHEMESRLTGRIETLEVVVRSHSQIDARFDRLDGTVDRLLGLEDRLTALERRH